MNVDSVNSPNSAANKSSESSSTPATVDYNQFLQLLIAQMKNQDPTSPTDMSQYMSQFAQLSAVEQAMQTNAKLDTLLSSSALAQAESLVGRTVSFTSSEGEDIKGKIMSVRIIQGGAVATLENGVDVQLGPGITIS
ncbi:flagellar hook assembly protein FlgD [Bradyrhizobium sp. Ai1a-2]|uniref:flagellar hook assembly protein FlgD n=1 Tax=Bradyrhizobium sp. Ai1a-2 TaxID=196490 RepID=UPI0003F869D4|nr:flagellar hook assembly protein FlgD [Bradyrhizobium sp. Ai1a-2]